MAARACVHTYLSPWLHVWSQQLQAGSMHVWGTDGRS